MIRAFRAVEAGPLSPGEYPALRSSSRSWTPSFDPRPITMEGGDTLLARADAALSKLTLGPRAYLPLVDVKKSSVPVTAGIENLRLETMPHGNGMKRRTRVVVFRAPEPWAGNAGLPMRMDPIERRAPRRSYPCLLPGCTNVGAPIYGMVCVEHRKTPKRKIARLRADREASRG